MLLTLLYVLGERGEGVPVHLQLLFIYLLYNFFIAKKCTPRNKKPTISTELPETTPNVKLSSAVFSLTPSTSTRKMGKHFTLQRNKATVTKAAPLPEQNFSVSQLSQEEIRFSQDASENLSKLFNNELWQRQS